jgi:uncharacterized membrane protein
MDPNLFHIDYERLVEVLTTIVILSFFIERALSVVFESRWFIGMYEANPKRKGLKELIALAVSVAVCVFWQFDAISILIVAHETMRIPGYILTGAIVAGGSKASIKFFKDVLGFMSNAEKERLDTAKGPTM